MKFEWEKIAEIKIGNGADCTYRAKVHGGWLIKEIRYIIITEKHAQVSQDSPDHLTFLPDPNHEWTID